VPLNVMFTKILDGISSTRRVHQPSYMTPTAPYMVGQLPASAMNSTAVDSVAQQQREPCWTILVLFPGDRCEPIPGRPSDTIASLRTTRLDNLWETHCDRSHYNHRAPYCYRVIMTTTRAQSGDELLALRDEDTLYKCGLRDGSKLRLVADDGPRPARRSSTVSENSNNCGDGPSTPSPKTRNSSRYRDDGGSGKRIVDYASSTHQKACIISPNAGVLASWSPSTYGHRPPSPAGGGYGFEQQQHEEPEMLNLSHRHNVFGGGAMDDESSRLTGSLVSRKAHQRLGLSPQETNTSCALPKLETVSLATGPSPDCFLDYWVMSSRHSQYSRGAVSACTGLSLQAAATMLTLASEGQTQPHRPFGCSLELLERILEEGSTYRGSAHEDLPSVLKRRQDLVEQGLQHINGSAASGGMVDVDPQQPYRGLVLGQRMAQDRGQLIAGVFTCQAQSIAMFFLPSSPDVFLFDSHSRADGSGPPAGAAFRFFSCLRDMCAYISILFRLEVDEPLDDMEANQLAIMSVGQVDFLSLEPIPSAAEEIRAAERNSVSQIDTRESDEEGKECGPQQRSPLKVDPAASDSDPVKMYHQEQYIDMRKELDAERRKRICAERKLAELSARLVHAQDAAPDARHQNLVARSQALETELEKERKRAADLGAQVGTLHRELARLHTTYGTAYGGTDTPWRHTRNETRRCALGSPSGDGEQVRQHQKQTEQDQELFLADIVVARNLQMEEEAAHAAVQRNRAIAFQLAAEMENAGERDGRGTGPDRTVRDERSRARNRRQFGK